MAVDYGVTAALASIEALLREDEPGVHFFWGPEDEARVASPPTITWEVVTAEPQEGVPQANVRPLQPRGVEGELPEVASFASDMVEVKARVVGAARRSTGRDPQTRRAEFTASEKLLVALRWAICRWSNFSPAARELRWYPLNNQGPEAAFQPICYHFAMRLDVLATSPLIAHPDTLEGDLVVET